MYLQATDVDVAGGAHPMALDAAASAVWVGLTGAQQADLLQFATDQVNETCGRSFEAAAAYVRRLRGNGTDEIYVPHVPLTALDTVAVWYPGQASATQLYSALTQSQAGYYLVDSWGRTIRAAASPVAYGAQGKFVGWPEGLYFDVTYDYGVDFTAGVPADPQAARLYRDVRRGAFLALTRLLHLRRTPPAVQTVQRELSREAAFKQPDAVGADGNPIPGTPTEADIHRALNPWVLRGPVS